MRIFKYIQLLLLIIYVTTNFAFSQSESENQTELTEQIEKYKVDKESKYIGDTLIITQIIKDIERAVNISNSDEIPYYFIDKREKFDKRNDLVNDKRKLFTKSFTAIDSAYIRKDKEKDKVFNISDVNFTIENDTIIIANVNIQFGIKNIFINQEIEQPDKKNLNKNKESQNEEINSSILVNDSLNIINDMWVFQNIYGQWKIISCENFMKMLNDLTIKK